MRTKHILLSIVLLVGCSGVAMADVPPDPGFKRISLNLIVESQTDFPDHRFFMRSGEDLKEITLTKDSKITIEPMGGGAYYRSGTLLALHRKTLISIEETNFDEILKAIHDDRVPGTIVLVQHSFTREVPILEASGWKDPVYRIEPDAQAGLKAVHLSGGAKESKIDNAASSGLAFWRSAAAAIVAGIFFAFGLLILGVLYFRKSSKAV